MAYAEGEDGLIIYTGPSNWRECDNKRCDVYECVRADTTRTFARWIYVIIAVAAVARELRERMRSSVLGITDARTSTVSFYIFG